MADHLILPIEIDLESAVNDAGAQWQSTFGAKLEKLIAKRPIKIAMTFDTKSLNNLKDVQDRLSKIKINPLSKQTKAAISDLLKELRQMEGTLKAIQQYANGSFSASPDAVRAARIANMNAESQAKQAILAQKAAEAHNKAQLASVRVQTAQRRLWSSTTKVNSALADQHSWLYKLTRRLVVYASISQIGNFLNQVREVTAQFELQRVSLGAILQSQSKADKLFGEIKSFALKSPIQLIDLTNYVKQVAAYRIEYDKLFDTTKRLADVSVGLGVDMSRIVLAYGQVKAASYLRASEIRQFTEAGVPMLEVLAQKFTALENRVVSTEEVMERVSKRMVGFGMVEQVFQDMTDAGGIFYNMQEKQGNTLYGMWQKLGDAASIMFNEIGSGASVNSTMKFLIGTMRTLMDHWTALASIVKFGAYGILVYQAAIRGLIPLYKLQRIQVMNNIAAEKRRDAVLAKQLKSFASLTRAQRLAIAAERQLTTAQWEEYIVKTKLNTTTALRLARLAAEDKRLAAALVRQKLYTREQLAQIQALGKWQYTWKRILAIGPQITAMFQTIGASLKSLAPLMLISSVIELFSEFSSKSKERADAIEKVNEKYEERYTTLLEIENAYTALQQKTLGEDGKVDKKLADSVFGQKLEQLQKLLTMLEEYSLGGRVDLSVVNTENIDATFQAVLDKLNTANNLSKTWGEALANVSTAIEGDALFGWAIFGENLTEDMKDLSRAWTKITSSDDAADFAKQVRTMRAEIANLELNDKDKYDAYSKQLRMDMKLALQQRQRNETELQYQKRIYENYEKIWDLMYADFGNIPLENMRRNYKELQGELNEVMHEINKTIGAFEGQDVMTIRMAIDEQFVEHEWPEWAKELIIDKLNEKRMELHVDLIPNVNDDTKQTPLLQGLKQVLATEFKTLFSDEQLNSFSNIGDVYEAISKKLEEASTELKQAYAMVNNAPTYDSDAAKKWEAKLDEIGKKAVEAKAKIDEYQQAIAALGEPNEYNSTQIEQYKTLIRGLKKKLAEYFREQSAIIAANSGYDKQLKDAQEYYDKLAETARDAMDRISDYGLSALGKDFRKAFSDLMVDPFAAVADDKYSTTGLFSLEDVQGIRDAGDLYDIVTKKYEEIRQEQERISEMHIDENALTEEQAAAQERLNELKTAQKDIEDQIRAANNGQLPKFTDEYNKLVAALNKAKVGTDEYSQAQKALYEYLMQNVGAKTAQLYMQLALIKAEQKQKLEIVEANKALQEYNTTLSVRLALIEAVMKRYNITPQENNKRGGSGEDPWITLMKNRMRFMQDFQKAVEEDGKLLDYSESLSQEQSNMLGRGLSLQINTEKLDGTQDELIEWYEDAIEQVREKIARMGGRGWEGLGVQAIIGKDTKNQVIKKYQELLQELWKNLTDFRTDKFQERIKRAIDEVADNISRTKTAKDFFDKVLGLTGDTQLALNIATSIYGESGTGLQDQIADQVRKLFNIIKDEIAGGEPIEIPVSVIDKNNRISYRELEKFAKQMYETKKIGEDMYNKLVKIAQDGQKDLAKSFEGYLKDLEVAKTYAQKRIELARTTAVAISDINNSVDYDETTKQYLIRGLIAKEQREAAKLVYEAFKDSPMYVQLFDDLDNASTTMLENMREKLLELQSQWKDLTPQQLKEMQKRLQEVNSQLIQRNPFKTLSSAIRQYRELLKDGTMQDAENALIDAHDKHSRAVAELNELLSKRITLQQEYDAIVNASGKDSADAKNKAIELEQLDASITLQQTIVDNTEEAERKAQDLVGAWAKLKGAIGDSCEKIAEMGEAFSSLLSGVADIMDAFGKSAEDVQYWRDLSEGVGKVMSGVSNLVQSFKEGDMAGMLNSVATAIPNMVTGFMQIFSAGKIRKANKEIAKQAERLEHLEYTYDKLADASDRLFGKEYTTNYQQQLNNLRAQADAYQKQYDAELSKGKSKDETKLKEYQQSYRDTMDEIAQLQDELVEHFTGQDITSAAKEFAESWLEARVAFEDTTASLQNTYKDMLRNMIVEGAAAKVVESILDPMYDRMSAMLTAGDISGAIDYLVNGMDDFIAQADNGLEVLYQSLLTKGYDMQNILGDSDSESTGISRDISTASEESINGLAAGINTQNYYISYVPQIYNEVSSIRVMMQAMQSGGQGSVTDLLTLQGQHLSYLPQIASSTASAAERCERAAAACEEIAASLGKVISPKQSSAAYAVTTKLIN